MIEKKQGFPLMWMSLFFFFLLYMVHFELKEAGFSYKSNFEPKNTLRDAKNTYFWNVYQ
jgi:hypothetical protein